MIAIYFILKVFSKLKFNKFKKILKKIENDKLFSNNFIFYLIYIAPGFLLNSFSGFICREIGD